MSLNHHILAKKTTDSILSKFKSGEWSTYNGVGTSFYRTGVSSVFPSPDAGFKCSSSKVTVSFEFKPPTETKRGILTGVGQSIAYLNSCNISFLIIPDYLEDFPIAKFISELFTSQVEGKVPVGLISFNVNDPSDVKLLNNVDFINTSMLKQSPVTDRFWAKHQDLPIELFHLILDSYYLRKTKKIKGDAFEYCWDNFLFPESSIDNLQAHTIKDLSGKVIRTLRNSKNIEFGSKNINKIIKLPVQSRQPEIDKLKKRRDPKTTGDTLYQSYRKNFLSFLKHIQVIDSEGDLTENGFNIYHLGVTHGASSKIFKDYFARTVLFTGSHLELILDLEELCSQHRGSKTFSEIKTEMEIEYESKGMIKKNPKRIQGKESNTDFLKYEEILWNALDLKQKSGGLPETCFNWKKITEICSLPEL